MTDSSNDSRIILLMDSNFPLIRLIRERREGGGGVRGTENKTICILYCFRRE